MFDTLINRICNLAEEQPDHIAIAFKQDRLTYKQLFDKMIGFAYILESYHVKKGDRVCYSATSKPEMVVAYLAIQLIGGIAVFLDKNSTAENMVAIYQDSDSVLLMTDKNMKGFDSECNIVSLKKIYREVDEIDVLTKKDKYFPFSVDENELSEILFTTGTTGKPKGVMLSFKSVYHILTNTIEGIHITNDIILLLPLPLNHSFALRVLRAILYKGATVVLQNGFSFAKEIENNIQLYHCNAMACVPTSYEVMKSQMQGEIQRILGNFRYIEFGAGSLTAKQRIEITKLLPDVTIYNTWGSSESGGAVFCNVTEIVLQPQKICSLGKPLEGEVEVKIVDSEGNEISSSESNPGRMTLKGEMKMVGYWKNEEATNQTLVDGWLLTGDMAYIDSEGYVYMLGRADDIINVGGEKVSPVEVENIAGQYEFIKECACIGEMDPDGVLGQIPVLFVVTKPEFHEKEFIKFLSEKMERFKIPQKIVTIQKLPRNRMQKIDRKELHRMWEKQEQFDMNPVVNNILSRRSIRNFSNKDIPKDILDTILKCGYYAPSGHNLQSWRFTVLTKEEDILELKEKTRISAEKNNVHFYGFENPKVIIMISNDNRNIDGCQDSSCAAENIMLSARSYGIGSVWLNPLMTLRNEEPVKELLDRIGIPKNHTIWATIAMGYSMSEGIELQKKADVIYYV